MKKIVIIAAILLLKLAVMAQQNDKRVAILETVDKYDKVDYGVRFQLRAFVTAAVNHTPGYEGYDRVDMSMINKEHDFQRTGMVSDADIKKIGQMTGASSIVVAEAAAYGNDRIIIAAKIINIESGRIENSTRPKVSSMDDNGMEQACKDVVTELLSRSNFSGNSTTSASSSASVPQGYVDLGLPSGTLWKTFNSTGFYRYSEAVSQFGTRLPTNEQWEELKAECQWQWTGSGYKVTGNNGNTMTLPAEGTRYCDGSVHLVGSWGAYLSSTPTDVSLGVNQLIFDSSRVLISTSNRCYGLSVRLVQK